MATSVDTLKAAAREHLWLAFSRADALADEDEPTILVRGEGSRVMDSDGRSYIDGIAALEAMVVGHGRAELAEAAERQLRELAFVDLFRYTSVPAVELAARLADLAPGDLSRVFFTPGGSEAVEVALGIARRYHALHGRPGKQKVVTRSGAFHGTTLGAALADGNYWSTRTEDYAGPSPIRRVAPAPACPLCDYGKASRHLACPHRIEELILTEGADTVAAVIVDPAASAIAVAAPPPSYLRELREVCDRHDVLLVVDEVITGFGRTGRWFCCEHSGVEPDLMTVSKALSSGYAPVGATLVSRAVADAFTGGPETALRYGHTYGGHPGACAVALANLDLIEREGLVEAAAREGTYLLDALRGLEGHPTLWDVRGLGMLVGVELAADETGRLFDDPGAVGTAVRRRCKANGLITLPLHPGSVMLFAPPLTTTRAELDELVAIFDTSLREVERELGIRS